MKLSIALIFVLCFLAAPAGAEELPDARAVLDRFVEVVGSRAALERIETRHFRGTVIQDLAWKEPRHQERSFVAETHADGTVLYAESTERADLPALDTGEPGRKLRWLMHPRFALVVEDFFPDLRTVRREIREGRPVIVLQPASLPREHYSLYFDEFTGLLSHIGFYIDPLDWQETGGVLFPSRVVFGRKGGHTTWVFEEITALPRQVH